MKKLGSHIRLSSLNTTTKVATNGVIRSQIFEGTFHTMKVTVHVNIGKLFKKNQRTFSNISV